MLHRVHCTAARLYQVPSTFRTFAPSVRLYRLRCIARLYREYCCTLVPSTMYEHLIPVPCACTSYEHTAVVRVQPSGPEQKEQIFSSRPLFLYPLTDVLSVRVYTVPLPSFPSPYAPKSKGKKHKNKITPPLPGTESSEEAWQGGIHPLVSLAMHATAKTSKTLIIIETANSVIIMSENETTRRRGNNQQNAKTKSKNNQNKNQENKNKNKKHRKTVTPLNLQPRFFWGGTTRSECRVIFTAVKGLKEGVDSDSNGPSPPLPSWPRPRTPPLLPPPQPPPPPPPTTGTTEPPSTDEWFESDGSLFDKVGLAWGRVYSCGLAKKTLGMTTINTAAAAVEHCLRPTRPLPPDHKCSSSYLPLPPPLPLDYRLLNDKRSCPILKKLDLPQKTTPLCSVMAFVVVGVGSCWYYHFGTDVGVVIGNVSVALVEVPIGVSVGSSGACTTVGAE